MHVHVWGMDPVPWGDVLSLRYGVIIYEVWVRVDP
jgi:hypothetical protein